MIDRAPFWSDSNRIAPACDADDLTRVADEAIAVAMGSGADSGDEHGTPDPYAKARALHRARAMTDRQLDAEFRRLSRDAS